MNSRYRSGSRGSVLMVAMIVMSVSAIAAASAASFCLNMFKLSWYSAARIQALHTAEAGVEVAIHAFNRQMQSGDGWTGWTRGTNGMFTLTADLVGASASSLASTFSVQADTNNLTITSRGTLANSRYAQAERTVEVVLDARPESSRSPFEWGLLSKDKLQIQGNPRCRSYDSALGAPGGANIFSNCDIGSMGQRADAISGGGAAQVWGDAAVSAGGGTVANPGPFWSGALTQDLDVDFPDVAPPRKDMTRAAIGNVNTTINIAGDVYIGVPSIGLVNKTLTIRGNGELTLYVAGALSVNTAASIVYAPSAGGNVAVRIFLNGAANIKGELNTGGLPANLQMFGTTNCLALDCQAKNDHSVVIYAPQADVDFGGNSTIKGAIVGNNIKQHGNPDFWYDEALANLEIPTNQQDPLKYVVNRWIERY